MRKRLLLFSIFMLLILIAVYLWLDNTRFSIREPNNPESERPYELRAGTHFSNTVSNNEISAVLTELKPPLFPGANSIWGATGRDDRGHIWFGISVQREEAAHLVEYIPEDDIFVDHGDPVTALKAAWKYRWNETQRKIHSKIIQADDGYLYLASMDDDGEDPNSSKLPMWGSHFWRYHPTEIAVSGVGRCVYALRYWDHLLYQYDTLTGKVNRKIVGSEGGHVSRNIVADENGHVYVPRVKYVQLFGTKEAEAKKLLVTMLVEFDENLNEVGSTPLTHYIEQERQNLRANHGIVGLSYLADHSIVINTHLGFLYRIIPKISGPAVVEEIGWFHPKGHSYIASVFPLDGYQKILGIGRHRGNHHELIVYDLITNSSNLIPLKVPQLRHLLIYGSNTRDDYGFFYIVGRHNWKVPLFFRLNIKAIL